MSPMRYDLQKRKRYACVFVCVYLSIDAQNTSEMRPSQSSSDLASGKNCVAQ